MRRFDPKPEQDPIERLDIPEEIRRLPAEPAKSRVAAGYAVATNPKTREALRTVRALVPKAEPIPVRALTRREWWGRLLGWTVVGGVTAALLKSRFARRD